MEKASIIYQFVLLFAIIGIFVMIFLTTGNVNEVLLGTIIGLAIGLPFDSKKAINNRKDDTNGDSL